MNTAPTTTPSNIPLSEPEISGNEWKYVKECLDTGWVSSAGSFVHRFENEFAAFANAEHAIAVANGTVGIHLALKLVGVQADDEVLVSNMTFIAPVNAISYCGAYPVLVDTSPVDWQIDPEKIARFLRVECEIKNGECFNRKSGRRVRAILPVHTLGLACRMDLICDLAREFKLKVVEDAAEGVGVRYQGQHIGTFGDVGIFSFNGNKIITAGSGGIVVTNNARYAENARYLTTQAKDDSVEYIHNEIGYNYRLTNIQAAIGVAQLERIGEFVERKRAIARKYAAAFADIRFLSLMPVSADVEPTFWLYTVLLNPKITLEQRKFVLKALNDNGIGARPFWHPIHGLPPYRSCRSVEIEHSVSLYTRGISLPCSVGLNDEDLDRCIRVFLQIIGEDALLR